MDFIIEMITIMLGIVSLFVTFIKMIGDMQKDIRKRIDDIYHQFDFRLDEIKERLVRVEAKIEK